MKPAFYILATHTPAGVGSREAFRGTRREARAAAKAKDKEAKDKGQLGQSTEVMFVRYLDGSEIEDNGTVSAE